MSKPNWEATARALAETLERNSIPLPPELKRSVALSGPNEMLALLRRESRRCEAGIELPSRDGAQAFLELDAHMLRGEVPDAWKTDAALDAAIKAIGFDPRDKTVRGFLPAMEQLRSLADARIKQCTQQREISTTIYEQTRLIDHAIELWKQSRHSK